MSSTARSPLPDSCCWTENALPPPHGGCVAGSGGLLSSLLSAETALLSASGLLDPVGPAHPRQAGSTPSGLLIPIRPAQGRTSFYPDIPGTWHSAQQVGLCGCEMNPWSPTRVIYAHAVEHCKARFEQRNLISTNLLFFFDPRVSGTFGEGGTV